MTPDDDGQRREVALERLRDDAFKIAGREDLARRLALRRPRVAVDAEDAVAEQGGQVAVEDGALLVVFEVGLLNVLQVLRVGKRNQGTVSECLGGRTRPVRGLGKRTDLWLGHLDHASPGERHGDGARAVLSQLLSMLATDLDKAVEGPVLVAHEREEVPQERDLLAGNLEEVGSGTRADGASVAVVPRDGDEGGDEREGEGLCARELEVGEAGLQVGHGCGRLTAWESERGAREGASFEGAVTVAKSVVVAGEARKQAKSGVRESGEERPGDPNGDVARVACPPQPGSGASFAWPQRLPRASFRAMGELVGSLIRTAAFGQAT